MTHNIYNKKPIETAALIAGGPLDWCSFCQSRKSQKLIEYNDTEYMQAICENCVDKLKGIFKNGE